MRKRVSLALLFIASLLSLVWLASSQSTASKSLTKAEPSTTPSKEAISAKLASLERGWVKNEGQWDQRALFSAPGYFGTTWIAKDGQLVHTAVKGKESWVISERWVGGKVQTVKGEEELQTKVSYFVGNDPSKHRSNLPTYRYVSLGEVWSGVEVKLKATQKTVEKLFYIKPGADPSKIVVEVDGAEGLRLSKDGEIIIQTTGEVYVAGYAHSTDFPGTVGGAQANYGGGGTDAFVARLNSDLTQILQATYLGGSYEDYPNALAISSTGDVYVAGLTNSNDFPGTTGGVQASNNGGYDAFVARLSADLGTLRQSTYLGGSDWDEAKALAISSTGDVYVAGYTSSTDFPGTTGGAQASSGGYSDAFVARLSADLTQILKSTYLGGSGDDIANALAISPTGDVYVAGFTNSFTDFPGTTGGAQETYGGGEGDTFVAKLNSDLTQILQSTYLGGSYGDEATALAISSTGDVYVAGYTSSTDFPGTTGGAQVSCVNCDDGYPDAFVARLSINLTAGPILSISPTPTNGTITSSPSGISCGSGGSMCSADFAYGITVTLTATPDPGYAFVGWEGDCRDICGNNTTCTITMDANKTCTANFAPLYTLSVSTPTNGNVSSNPAGISCGSGGSACSANFAEGTLVTLTATPDPGYAFVGWGGDCSSCLDNPTCIIPMSANTTCTANFAPLYTLSIPSPPTNGTITSSPAGINCGSGSSACSADFAYGITVTLTATPDPGYAFVGWGDGCASCGTNTTCTITIGANTTCTANFAVSSGGGSGGGSGSDSGSGSGGSGTGGSGSGSGGGSGSDTGSGGGSSGGSDSGSGSGGSGTGGSGSGSGGGSGSDTGSGSGSSGGSGSGTGGGGSGSGVGGGIGGGSGTALGSGGTCGGGGGGGCSMTGSASSMAGLWNIVVWLSVPAFVVARRIIRK